jgi:hypothetical protein
MCTSSGASMAHPKSNTYAYPQLALSIEVVGRFTEVRRNSEGVGYAVADNPGQIKLDSREPRGQAMRRIIFLLTVLTAAASSGCALDTYQQALQKRVTDLETQVKKLEAEKKTSAQEDANRRQRLENCVTTEANETYWTYIRLNGKLKSEGTYLAPQYVWDQARRQKLDKIEECKLLYGSQ